VPLSHRLSIEKNHGHQGNAEGQEKPARLKYYSMEGFEVNKYTNMDGIPVVYIVTSRLIDDRKGQSNQGACH
jgi:hypothetical protein